MTPETTPTLTPVTPEEGQSADLIRDNIDTLKRLMPEVVTEGKVDFDVLRQLLGDAEVLEEGEEKFGLNWHGKKRARQVALMPSVGTLRPCPKESVDWDTTQNLFIEGDNLEVLKLLQKSYANQVKMIYIDPPYNTGNEFIYPDRFEEGLETYLRYTGQKDENGQWTTSEQDRAGKKHTNWLNMMYPRLKLAKNLLRDDGVIFISIDEGEVANLRKVCNEIFGEENFVGNIAWKKTSGDNKTAFAFTHDNVLIFQKKENAFPRIPLNSEQLKQYKNPDNDPRGDWAESDYRCKWTKLERPNLYYSIKNPNTGELIYPDTYSASPRVWGAEQATHIQNEKDGLVWWGANGKSKEPKKKRFLNEHKGANTRSVWLDAGSNDEGGKELKELLGGDFFDNPKPIRLLEKIIAIPTKNKDIVLDFFAGSGTTANACMCLNAKGLGNRNFIVVQLPEATKEKSEAFKAGYKTIADIGKERIRRAAAKLKQEHPDYQGDLGFKVFKLDSSNIKPWNPNPDDLEHALFHHKENILPGRSEEDVLYELLLKRGIDLASPIEKRTIAGKTVNSIGRGALFACLTESITANDVEELAQGIVDWHEEYKTTLGDDVKLETHVFFRDSAFVDDVAKTNLAAILHQQGLKHVRSL